eukprot:2689225-Prymnesium_polylepis.2
MTAPTLDSSVLLLARLLLLAPIDRVDELAHARRLASEPRIVVEICLLRGHHLIESRYLAARLALRATAALLARRSIGRVATDRVARYALGRTALCRLTFRARARLLFSLPLFELTEAIFELLVESLTEGCDVLLAAVPYLFCDESGELCHTRVPVVSARTMHMHNLCRCVERPTRSDGGDASSCDAERCEHALK